MVGSRVSHYTLLNVLEGISCGVGGGGINKNKPFDSYGGHLYFLVQKNGLSILHAFLPKYMVPDRSPKSNGS